MTEHDLDRVSAKCVGVFEKDALGLDPRDHAPTKTQSGMMIQRKVITL
jgi:hypothetical protein